MSSAEVASPHHGDLVLPNENIPLCSTEAKDVPDYSEEEILQDSLDMHNGCVKRANEQVRLTLAWRRTYEVDRLLESPWEHFELLKQATPTCLAGRTRDGSVVSYEFLGRGNNPLISSQPDAEDLLTKHIALHTEYIRRVLHRGRRDLKTLAVLDMKGMTLGKASNSFQLRITRTYAETLTTKQPYRLGDVLIINPPFGTSLIKHCLSAVMPRAFVDRMIILNELVQLQQYIDPDNIPTCYGGNNTTPLDDFPEEKGLRELVQFNRERSSRHKELTRQVNK